eukprot:TRINITY_DN318_c0_g1_i14.p1 TRINITY_DN318_c0_g1~~TRINITY_DN318_c0_g1_i14.p1  ORF type:complete len:189 (-),score=22.00 TRINITY_DN318_c0_g1_i14:1231-1797(-)
MIMHVWIILVSLVLKISPVLRILAMWIRQILVLRIQMIPMILILRLDAAMANGDGMDDETSNDSNIYKDYEEPESSKEVADFGESDSDSDSILKIWLPSDFSLQEYENLLMSTVIQDNSFDTTQGSLSDSFDKVLGHCLLMFGGVMGIEDEPEPHDDFEVMVSAEFKNSSLLRYNRGDRTDAELLQEA